MEEEKKPKTVSSAKYVAAENIGCYVLVGFLAFLFFVGSQLPELLKIVTGNCG